MASTTRWTWVWASSRSWWWTGKPGELQSMGLQRIGHNWATELTDFIMLNDKAAYTLSGELLITLWKWKKSTSEFSLMYLPTITAPSAEPIYFLLETPSEVVLPWVTLRLLWSSHVQHPQKLCLEQDGRCSPCTEWPPLPWRLIYSQDLGRGGRPDSILRVLMVEFSFSEAPPCSPGISRAPWSSHLDFSFSFFLSSSLPPALLLSLSPSFLFLPSFFLSSSFLFPFHFLPPFLPPSFVYPSFLFPWKKHLMNSFKFQALCPALGIPQWPKYSLRSHWTFYVSTGEKKEKRRLQCIPVTGTSKISHDPCFLVFMLYVIPSSECWLDLASCF